jgi:hypothetical protein
MTQSTYQRRAMEGACVLVRVVAEIVAGLQKRQCGWLGGCEGKGAKVFWFFFSKKNRLRPYLGRLNTSCNKGKKCASVSVGYSGSNEL